MKYEFPKDFTWGVATAAAQIEGAAYEDGRGPSIWDVFSSIPGKILHDDKPTIACDSYHRFREDVALMKKMGLKSYRFSFSWSRIIPDGSGEVNPKGIAYYKELIACLKENGIVPNATIYHWDLPYMLQIQGGFGNRKIIEWYTRYAQILFDNFGDDIDYWVTFNEPIAVFVGHAKGFFAPGLQDEAYARQCLHHLMICHGETVKLFRQRNFSRAQIGIVVDVWKHYAGRKGNAADEAEALYNNEIVGYGMFLNPLFLGSYSEELMSYMKEHDMVPVMQDGDMETICQKLDFYGLNFYNGLFDDVDAMEAKRVQREQQGGNYQDRPELHVEVLPDVLHMLVDKYQIRIPIMITENGLPQTDSEDVEALLNDQERIDYVRDVLKYLHQAMQEGIDVRGYYMWALMDNFEWSVGYEARYGLHYTDYKTLERIPKKSAGWYADVIRNNGFEA